jgi:hypothetical protein
MHEAAHSLTTVTLCQTVQLLDQCGQDGRRLEQVNGDEMVRDQHLAQLQIAFDSISEQSAWKCPAFATRHNDPALPAAAKAGELPGEAEPSVQVKCGECLPHQRIDRPDLIA